MVPELVALALAAAPPTIAVPGLNGVRLAPGEVDLYADLMSNKLTEGGLKVFTSRDIAQLLGVERQRELLGCSEGSSCITEMVGALGVDGVLVGDIGALGDEYVLNFRILSAKDGMPFALYSGRAKSVKTLPDELEAAARSLLHQIAQKLGRPELEPLAVAPPKPAVTVEQEQPVSASTGYDYRKWAIIPAVVGVGAVVVGAVFRVLAQNEYDTILGASTPDVAMSAASRGKTYYPASIALLSVGAAAVVAAGALFLFGKSEPKASAGVVLVPGGATFAFQGTFP
jgi:hypothetical protein